MPHPTPRDLDRIQAVTANYFFWQGLRWVPMGAALLALSTYWNGWWTVAPSWEVALELGLLLLALGLSAAAGRYYHGHFGTVQGIPGAHARRERLKWSVVYPLMTLSLVADILLAPPVLLSGFVWGGGILAYRRSTGGGRPHYAVAAVVLAIFGLFPLAGLAQAGKALVNSFMGLVGVAFLIGGVLDHLELTRLLRPVRSATDETTV